MYARNLGEDGDVRASLTGILRVPIYSASYTPGARFSGDRMVEKSGP